MLKESPQLGCVSQDSCNLFYVNLETWEQNTPSKSLKAPGAKLKFGKEWVHREELSLMCASHERSPCHKIQNQNKKSDRKKSDDPLADPPEWLEELKENLVDPELPASAHSSQQSDLEHPTKVATKSRKH